MYHHVRELMYTVRVDRPDPAFGNMALITAAQKVEHYEISGYTSVRAVARQIGMFEVADLLSHALDDIGADVNLENMPHSQSQDTRRKKAAAQ
jgi:ferritin-like metal-binding protein YciE